MRHSTSRGALGPWPGTEDGPTPSDGSLVLAATAPRAGVLVIRAIGEIDLLTAPGWRRSLGAGVRRLQLEDVGSRLPRLACDLSSVTFLGATGLAVLAGLAENCPSYGVDLRVVAPPGSVARLLYVTGLDRCLAVVPTTSVAVDPEGWARAVSEPKQHGERNHYTKNERRRWSGALHAIDVTRPPHRRPPLEPITPGRVGPRAGSSVSPLQPPRSRTDDASPGSPLRVLPSQPSIGVIVIELRGELDQLTVERARRVLMTAIDGVETESARPRERLGLVRGRVVCDLNGLDFLSVRGLRTLVDVTDHARTSRVEFVLLASATPVRRVLSVSGLDHVLLGAQTEAAP